MCVRYYVEIHRASARAGDKFTAALIVTLQESGVYVLDPVGIPGFMVTFVF